MKTLHTEVLVIGGGATGTGIIRDLAMRGFKCALIERRDLSDGTTGRFHGLLHSGGRYVVKDPQAAKECIEENHILRRIMPACLEDTGGFFVLVPGDDPDYVPHFLLGCKNAGIPVEELSTHQMLSEEPNLNPNISRCFRVPDASADSFLASELNALSARDHGAEILTYHEVSKLIRVNDRIVGAECYDLVKDETIHISADLVVLAAGAWSGVLSSTAGIDIKMIFGKGSMIAVNHRLINTVINRCKMPSDGDILVPIHSVSIMGTTDISVKDPDHYSIDPWEIRLMLDEGEKLVPGFRSNRILRAWAGVRPLYQETTVNRDRELSRAYVLIDHTVREGIEGLVTITSGKWTTFRKMAEVTSDLVCHKLGIDRICRTHLEALPHSTGKMHYVSAPLARVEAHQTYGSLICECELATYDDLVSSIIQKEAKTFDDIRRDIRLGMGPCQGGYCSYRATGIIQDIRKLPVEAANGFLGDFLRERWKGLLPVLWGSQLRQERMNELIYLNVLNMIRLPGLSLTRLGSMSYERAEISKGDTRAPNKKTNHPGSISPVSYSNNRRQIDVLVIGGGLSGLTCAMITSMNNKATRLISKGWGSQFWDTGCIDLFGHSPIHEQDLVICPLDDISELISHNPLHPYALVGLETIHEAIEFMKHISDEAGYPLEGKLENNWLIPTSIGSIHPTCLAPRTMIAGDLHNKDPMLIVGIEGFYDFYPGLVSGNLNSVGVLSNQKVIRLASLENHRMINGMLLARLFENEEFRDEVVRAIKPHLGGAKRIGLPAILGLNPSLRVHTELEEKLECPIFEIPGLPPSIPGFRLHKMLLSQISDHGGRAYDGMEAVDYESSDHQLKSIFSEAAARFKQHQSNSFVLATGEFLGGGLRLSQTGEIHESLLDLPIQSNYDQIDRFHDDFFSNKGHPIFQAGVRVDPELRPIDNAGNTIFSNLYAIGSILDNCDPVRELSLAGIAISTGYKLGSYLSAKQ